MNSEPASAATRLCAACGMCCDGVLFHAVVLQAGDSPRALAALGLKIKRRRDAQFFHQPCRAHRDGSCTIYAQRPQRCRLFACRQLLGVAAGETTEAVALEKIREARARVARVNALLDRVAETNPRRALAQRYANAMTGPVEGDAIPARAELVVAMRELEALLARDFRTEAAETP